MALLDPPEPPEGGGLMKATDLVNRSCIFRPTGMGEWPAKPATEDQKAQGPQPYVNCDVWVLDRAGVIESSSDVRVSWWKAVEQLRVSMGQFTGAKPKKEEGTNAIWLSPLSVEAREVAARVVGEIEASESAPTPPPDDERPFEPSAAQDTYDDDPDSDPF